MNRLRALEDYGQSIWLDYIRRSLLDSGELRAMIEADGLKGLTSNPAIFEKALGGAEYTEELRSAQQTNSDPGTIYETVAIADIRRAADILRPVYDSTDGADGYVSLEVSPHLADNTAETISEARRLWTAVNRPNLMVKVPGTPEGIPAFQRLISDGVNVNVTLLFSVQTYARVAAAYISGLQACWAKGMDIRRICSVASFFVSRIDTKVDGKLEKIVAQDPDPGRRALATSLLGRVAIANAKLAYVKSREIYGGQAWSALARNGARKQRLLWASTGTKNPAYRDTLYVEELIGPETVNTVPPATMDAFREHGELRASLTENLVEADETLNGLRRLGIDFEQVTQELLDEGVVLFKDAFDKLIAALETAAARVPAGS